MNSPPASNVRTEPGKGAIIYVVDDEPMVLELASAVLAPQGYRLKTFRDGGAALESFTRESEPPALIITDYAMAGMTGLRLLQECRRVRPGQKVLMVSGTVHETFFANVSPRFDRFLAKPYQVNELVDLVEVMTRT